MAVYMYVFLFVFLIAMVFALLSYTSWAQEHMRWITGYYFYICLGAIVGICLIVSGFYIANSIHSDVPLPLDDLPN